MREIDALLLSEEGQRGQQELAQAQQALRVAELALSLETRVLYHVADCFLSSGFKNVQTIALARVPVVKLEDPVHGFEVDICLNNRIAACNTALLRTYLRMDDRIRDVVFLVKAWTKARCISDSAGGSLSSYGWVILVIHFFQQIGLLPNLQGEEAIALLNAPRTVCDNIDVTFLEDCVLGKEKLPRKQVSCAGSLPTASVAKLFREFLAYYATSFDWIRSVASIHSPNFAVRSKVDAMGPKCGVLQLKILSRLLTRRVPMTWAALSTKRGH
jgi:DNA polymerase sigma